MNEGTLTSQTEIRKDVQVDGVSLGIIVRRIEEDEWELSVESPVGARSVWIETFPTALAALKAGLEAIEAEGAKSFSD